MFSEYVSYFYTLQFDTFIWCFSYFDQEKIKPITLDKFIFM